MFRKILFTILCLFVLSGSAFAADYFLDLSHDQANGGDGTTMQTDGGADDAFKTFAEVIAANPAAGSAIWVRRIANVTHGASITLNDNGTATQPIFWIGWPRDADSWDCDWVNGSTTVDNIDENDATWSTHAGRWITGPDGFDYLITAITDTNTVVIDRPYAGATAANEVVAIKADELPLGISEPADTDSWSADGDDLVKVNFDGGPYAFIIVPRNNQFWNFEFTDANNHIVKTTGIETVFNGCLFYQVDQNNKMFVTGNAYGNSYFNRCIFRGNSGAAVTIENNYANLSFKNCAIYGMGARAIASSGGNIYLENVNMGVEVVNESEQFYLIYNAAVTGRDVILDGTNGFMIAYDLSGVHASIILSNYGKELGAFKQWFHETNIEKTAVTGTNANKKLSDNVIEITLSTTGTDIPNQIEQMYKVFESRKTYAAGTYNVKVWIYNDTGNTLNDTTFSDDILMRCRAEAGNYGDATTEYVSMPWTYSDEIDILDAADADDWDYLQCDSVVVDQASKIYCEVLVSTYDAQADVILIDPSTTNP